MAIPGGLFEASTFFDQHRRPELFCASAVLMLTEACLGLTVDAVNRRVMFCQPALLSFLAWLRIIDLWLGDATLDVTVLTEHATLGRCGRSRSSVGASAG